MLANSVDETRVYYPDDTCDCGGEFYPAGTPTLEIQDSSGKKVRLKLDIRRSKDARRNQYAYKNYHSRADRH